MATTGTRTARSLNTTAQGRRAPANQPRSGRNNREDLPKAEGWVNVGQSFDSPETGERDFIGLPFGLDVTNMRNARGNGPISQSKNALLEKIRQKLDEMEPGERIVLPLEVELYKPGEPNIVGDEDPMMSAVNALRF